MNIVEETKKIDKEFNYFNEIDSGKILTCKLLFISKSKKDDLEKILEITNGKAILTMGDTKGMGEKGVLINFFLSKHKVRFEINEEAVQSSGLILSVQLLQLSKSIKRKK